MKKMINKLTICLLTVMLIFPMLSFVAHAEASVTKGEYDFSDMTIRRVWFNTSDPVFLIDDYERVWLSKGVNVVATGDYKETTSAGSLMAPMEEMFKRIGGEYSEVENIITIKLNGDTLEFTIGSKDVKLNGQLLENALSESQKPVRVNAKNAIAAVIEYVENKEEIEYREYNTFLTEDYFVTYLPAAYILNIYQADIYADISVESLYAAIPVFKTDKVPSYSTVAVSEVDGKTVRYGNRYDMLSDGTMELKKTIVNNIVSLQNEDGGFPLLPMNVDMEQSGLAVKLGTLDRTSTLEGGATVNELTYLAKYITAKERNNTTYINAFKKGIEFLLENQHSCGGWQLQPTAPVGYYGNIAFTDGAITNVLSLFSDIALLNDQNYVFARKHLDIDPIKNSIEKGLEFILSSQEISSGWASQYTYKEDSLEITMGRTYERESINAVVTADIVRFLMSVRTPSEKLQSAIRIAANWLESVKIEDKEAVIIKDVSMQNGYDIFLLDGDGTWAVNYQLADNTFKPLYADVDPKRPYQECVNAWDEASSNKMIWYATRTSIKYYVNDLAVSLLENELPTWEDYLINGFPELPIDPIDSIGGKTKPNSSSDKSTTDTIKTSWKQDSIGWWFVYQNGGYPISKWELINNKWYYFNSDGYMVAGWVYLNNHWYYLNTSGEMVTGWLKDNQKWYYLYQSGNMATGWVKDKDKWYYLNPSGDMAADTTIGIWYVDAGGVWVE